MNSEKNIAAVRAVYEAFARDDLDGALTRMHPDVKASPQTSWITGLHDDYSGQEGLRRWDQQRRERQLAVVYSLREIRALDANRVFAEVSVSTYQADRPGPATLIVTIWHLLDGVIINARTYTDPNEGRIAAQMTVRPDDSRLPLTESDPDYA
jgi:ketosteroid isomerase-like protein